MIERGALWEQKMLWIAKRSLIKNLKHSKEVKTIDSKLNNSFKSKGPSQVLTLTRALHGKAGAFKRNVS